MKRDIAIKRRPLADDYLDWAWPLGMSDLLKRVFAQRDIKGSKALDYRLKNLLPPSFSGMLKALERLSLARQKQQRLLIVGDYDCDGATGTAVAVRGLAMLGFAHVDFSVPNRAKHGYGLSPALLASLPQTPDLIITVDNGVAAIDGVAEANNLGVDVIVTDHHLPGAELPQAVAMINPNLDGEAFPSKALAGVGVMFYLLLALRRHLRKQGIYTQASQPDLSVLLDLVALGTIADIVPLDYNNRVLVEAGLRRIRKGQASAGVMALVAASGRDFSNLVATDIAFAVAPRLNAAGRLTDMRQGILCLLSDDIHAATAMADELSHINQERKQLQQEMLAEAEQLAVPEIEDQSRWGIALKEPHWHAGIIGLVAAKIKDRLYRPVIAFAPVSDENAQVLRGSARSIPGLHIRDVLADIAAHYPAMLSTFGGHAMAAGLTLAAKDFPQFAQIFDQVVRRKLSSDDLDEVVWSDGAIEPQDFTLDIAQALRRAGPWGQKFPAPMFDNTFICQKAKIMGKAGTHRRLYLLDPRDQSPINAVMFNVDKDFVIGSRIHVVYELAINEWQGKQTLQLIVRHVQNLA